MKLAAILDQLRVIFPCTRSFSFDECLPFIEEDIEASELQIALQNDPRFISLRVPKCAETRFIYGLDLFRWFMKLNLRLSNTGIFRLDASLVASLMSQLRREGRWDTPPEDAINWASSFGLIGNSFIEREYIFPLAKMLDCLSPQYRGIALDVLRESVDEEIWIKPLDRCRDAAIDEGFAHFGERLGYIIRAREGLLTNHKLTLEQVGDRLGLTRERVRQLQREFWKGLEDRIDKRKPFISALLYDFMHSSGSVIIEENVRSALLKKFLVKCVGIPVCTIADLVLPGVSKLDLPKKANSLLDSDGRVDLPRLSTFLRSKGKLFLMNRDVSLLASRIANLFSKNLGTAERLYLTLKKIGKPAHFSHIAEVYNSLFPKHAAEVETLHNALIVKKGNIVWIGVKGTYALKEWGYERPSEKLFDTIAAVVRQRFDETNKPVPLTVIAAEISKVRKVIVRESLIIATYLNPELCAVSKDSFVPKDVHPNRHDEISAAELDEVLRAFQNDS